MRKNTSTKGDKSRSTPSQKKASKKRGQQSVPINYAKVIVNSGPKTNNSKKIIISHRELCESVIVPTNAFGFRVLFRKRVNPGSVGTNSWLAVFGQNYESFVIRKFHIIYVPRTSTIVDGNIHISPDYDAADRATSTEKEITSNVNTVTSQIWKETRCVLDPAKLNRLYKAHVNMDDQRFSNTSQDQKTIDPAFFSIAVDFDNSSLTQTRTLGKVYVEYTVEFFEPQHTTFPLDLGGAGTNKTNGFNNTNTTRKLNPFITTSLSALNQSADHPVVTPIENSSGDARDLFMFERDWQGLITSMIKTSLTNSILNTDFTPLIDGSTTEVVNLIPNNRNTLLDQMMGQFTINAKRGQKLGFRFPDLLDAASVLEFRNNFGGFADPIFNGAQII